MNIQWIESAEEALHLYPFTLSRPTPEIRIGALTLSEKWLKDLNGTFGGYHCSELLQNLFGGKPDKPADIFIKGNCIPNMSLVKAIQNLKKGTGLKNESGEWLAYKPLSDESGSAESDKWKGTFEVFSGSDFQLKRTYEIFSRLAQEIPADINRLKLQERVALCSSNKLIGSESDLYIHPSAKVQGAIINTTTGPVYVAANAEIMEGSMVRGPFYLGEGSSLKMGAKVYGPTAIGPYSKFGGELNNIQCFGYSNKGHDGFLGNSVLGEWCNLGADTNNSNLKNNYAEVKLWNHALGKFEPTGLQFCGLIMGDHSKAGINTMFNTGTVVGFSANIFGPGFPRNHIPSFSWGGASGFTTYQSEAALKTAELVFERRNKTLSEADRLLFQHIFESEVS
jgi:UDP-N-acetylglucosamine diphosphorylase/glucosamine-1-phosphate N-acetyltransferase